MADLLIHAADFDVAAPDAAPPPAASAWSRWDGTVEVPLVLAGLWDGTSIAPLRLDGEDPVVEADPEPDPTPQPAPFEVRYSFDGGVFTPTSVTGPVEALALIRGNLLAFEVNRSDTTAYASHPALYVRTNVASPTMADSIANNGYFAVPLRGTGLNLDRIRFNAAKGGTGLRGFGLRASNDGFTTDLVEPREVPSTRPTWTPFDLDLSQLADVDDVNLRFYIFTPTTNNSVEFDDLVITGTALPPA